MSVAAWREGHASGQIVGREEGATQERARIAEVLARFRDEQDASEDARDALSEALLRIRPESGS